MMTDNPNQQNWQPYNKLKRPGEVRLLSYQAMAHGSDTCLFFQMRQSAAGQEKFHGAVISHAGHENTRIFREISTLGHELGQIGDLFLEGRIAAKVGIFFDWNNWWSLELSSGPSRDMNYLNSVFKYYKAFYERNIPVDMIAVDVDISRYQVLIAPMLYMMKEGVAEKITEFVRKGGTLIATTMTGLVDENDRAVFGEYPGKLRDVLGVWVEETDALFPDEKNTMMMLPDAQFPKASYDCRFLCDIVHPRGAKALALYGADFYKNVPCFTVNSFGDGTAYYIGTEPEDGFLSDLVQTVAHANDLHPVYPSSAHVEITNRVSGKASVVFAMNHNHEEAEIDFGSDILVNLLNQEEITGKVKIAPRDVLVLKKV